MRSLLPRLSWNRGVLLAGLLLLVVGLPWLVREVATLPRGGQLAARAGQRIVTLEVAGMTSDTCAAAVRSGLAAVPGVTTVAVRRTARRAHVICDPAVTDSALTRAVRLAGPAYAAAVAER